MYHHKSPDCVKCVAGNNNLFYYSQSFTGDTLHSNTRQRSGANWRLNTDNVSPTSRIMMVAINYLPDLISDRKSIIIV